MNETSIDSGRVQNERLEFLGDAVLGLAVAHMLYEHSPDMAEGDLARIKSVVVSEATLATIASHLKIPSFIKLGRGEELSGGRNKPAIIADAMEALIGAIFLDSGYEAAMRAVEGFLSPSIREAIISGGKDHKTLLQEYCQKHFRRVPEYVLVKSEGPEHRRVFWVSCQIGEKSYGPFSGTTKKDAEMNAARSAYEALISPITTRT